MHGLGLINAARQKEIIHFTKDEDYFSTNTLNRYIHSMEHFPNKESLKSMWDTLEPFVLDCIRQSQKKKAVA